MTPAAAVHHGLATFANGDDLAATLSRIIADELRVALAARGNALLAVSGGNTPKRLFEALSRQTLDWRKVTITLVDERWTSRGSNRSNAVSVERGLLQNEAADARFVDLYEDGMDIDDAAPILDARIAALGLPFDAIVLGMGLDGHTASFFPGGQGLADAVDATTHRHVAVVRAEAAIEPRITLTLPTILGARFLALHIEGEAKRLVLEEALGAGNANAMPIRHVLRARRDLPVFWAP